MKGWISLHRSIMDGFLWDDKPFSRGQAWIDLLLLVNHKDAKILFDGKTIEVKRGETITSIVKLSERWGWGRKKVSGFLDVLEKEQMLEQKRTSKNTSLTIVNYGFYQDRQEGEEQLTHITGTSEEHHRNTNNNVNNDNNDNKEDIVKIIHGEFKKVKLTNTEYQKLVAAIGEKETKQYIVDLDAYIETKKKRYSNHYATIQTWYRGKHPGFSFTDIKKEDTSLQDKIKAAMEEKGFEL